MRNLEERKERLKELEEAQKNAVNLILYIKKEKIPLQNIYDLQECFRLSLIGVKAIEELIEIVGEEQIKKIFKGDKI